MCPSGWCEQGFHIYYQPSKWLAAMLAAGFNFNESGDGLCCRRRMRCAPDHL